MGGASGSGGSRLMPMAAPKLCAHPGCGALVARGYCEKHVRPHGWESDKTRGNRHERGYGSQWEKLRKAVLRRDSRLCQVCLQQGRVTPANEVDHIIPKAKGGQDDPPNLQSICRPCHQAKTARE